MTLSKFAAFSAAIGLSALLAAPAAAFSQIGTKDGAAPQRDGIVSVPLPPLAGTAAPTPAPQPPTPGAAGETPPAGPTQPPATSPGGDAPATTTPPAPSTEPAGPNPAPPAGTDETPPAEGSDGETPGEDEKPEAGIPAGAIATTIEDEDVGPPPTVVYGDEGLPKPVRDLREKLMSIAKSGDIEALRPYIAVGEEGTLLSFGGADGDPIQFLKSASGDGEGVETLAIMLEVLEAGHVRTEPDSDSEIFVWPYFTAMAVDKLTKPQKVELFELVTAGDYQEMLSFGAYNFYRLGITPDGKLQFFVAGD